MAENANQCWRHTVWPDASHLHKSIPDSACDYVIIGMKFYAANSVSNASQLWFGSMIGRITGKMFSCFAAVFGVSSLPSWARKFLGFH